MTFCLFTASLLDPETSDYASNHFVEQLQLVQPQFVERYVTLTDITMK